MTALQWIIKEAKILRKKSPKMEWKKAVAQASAIYASKHKGKSPVGKKHKKPSEKAVLKSIQHSEKIQKSHMSVGRLNMHIINRLENITKEIEQREDVIASVLHRKKDLISKNGKSWYIKWMKLAKGHISELKKHKTELKRFI